jgi:hypothetical protein
MATVASVCGDAFVEQSARTRNQELRTKPMQQSERKGYKMQELIADRIPSPIGEVVLVVNDNTLVYVDFVENEAR